MPITSSSFTIHRKAKDGLDAVIYSIQPTATVVPEGTVDVNIALVRIQGDEMRTLTFSESLTEHITLVGEDDAADCVEWNASRRRLHLASGAIYGARYTIVAINGDGQRVAVTTIGVTARGGKGDPGDQGEQGRPGRDGTGIDIKGTALQHFLTVSTYNAAQKTSGLYLVNQKVEMSTHGSVVTIGAYVYQYDQTTDTTTSITEASIGDTYIVQENGHLYLCKQPIDGQVVQTKQWFDAGEVRGADAITINADGENILFPEEQAYFFVYISVFRGAQPLVPMQEFSCSVLGEGQQALDGKVKWTFGTTPDGRFYYRLRTNNLGEDISGNIPYTITVDDVQYHRTINVRTVRNGAQGFSGCLIRRTEWEAGKQYRNDGDHTSVDPETSQYIIDEVTITDGNESHSYLVTPAHRGKTSGATDEAGNLIKPGLPTPEGGWNYDTDNPYYTLLQPTGPLRTPYADITRAFIQYLQAQQIVITQKNAQGVDVPYGAFGAATPTNPYPLWFGGADPLNAIFRVDRQGNQWNGPNFSVVNGHVDAVGGSFSGFFYKKRTVITAENFYTYCHKVQSTTSYYYTIDLKLSGTWIDIQSIPEDAYDGQNIYILFELPSFQLYRTYGTKDEARALIGNTIVVYNNVRQSDITFQGWLYDKAQTTPDTYINQYGIQADECAILTCTIGAVGGTASARLESVYWQVEKAITTNH